MLEHNDGAKIVNGHNLCSGVMPSTESTIKRSLERGGGDVGGGGTPILNGYPLPNRHAERGGENEGQKEGRSTSNCEPNKGSNL